MFDNTAGIIKIDRLCVAVGIDPVHEGSSGGTRPGFSAQGARAQPDGCVFPKSRLQRDRGSWPTMVIESGVVASLPRLREDARWWLHNSQGEVQIVLVVGINRQRRKLVVEKWEQQKPALTHQPPRHPQASLQAHATQIIEMSFLPASRAALVLPFEELFDRPRQGRETDILL
ncbi:hypothetical protein CFD26_107920 [Aspergillus turcosus]|uniref:Uncharacterized protein n=1 Tax=Aspergillus turcosus TaxID=1245748 RepID=A0A421DDC0_9EURO|nr:hypothetical protein CFD26_107920 [Aspergillus turcosus]